jgi:hypothetical protein
MKNERYIPQGFIKYEPDLPGYKNLFACYVRLGEKPSAIFYIGKRSSHSWFYSFKTDEDMKKKINESISQLMSWEDKKLERKNERKNATLDINVGDVLYNSWGYDQTNVDFYQVVEVKGKTFTIRQINEKIVGGGGCSMSEYVAPVKDAFVTPNYPGDTKGLPITKRSFNMNVGMLSKTTWDEKHYQSHYA